MTGPGTAILPDLERLRSRFAGAAEELDYRTILGVSYLHARTVEGDDLYFTAAGIPYIEHLLPRNFARDREWFQSHRASLDGSSIPYRVSTRNFDGRTIEVVFKWNRMGTDPMIPGNHQPFNSPFEEFALIHELRQSSGRPVRTQEPLAVYVPAERSSPESLQRKGSLMQILSSAHREFELDMTREYAVIFEWVPGVNLYDLVQDDSLEMEEAEGYSNSARDLLAAKGYAVTDHKMTHVIVEPQGQEIPFDGDGELAYTLIDFELLHRTSSHEAMQRRVRRRRYFEKQLLRGDANAGLGERTDLHLVNIMGIDYVCGPVSSTGGYLWVIGRDPELFDYFLPEKWQKTPRHKLTNVNQTFYTNTRDDIDIVWKVSKVGEKPIVDPLRGFERSKLEYGYNSPFEEVRLAFELDDRIIRTTSPRAIYRSGHMTRIIDYLYDESRYRSHLDLLTPEGVPVLWKDHDYMTIWEYWTGTDEQLLRENGVRYIPVDAVQAYYRELLDENSYYTLMQYVNFKLARAGYRDLNYIGNHLLLSLDEAGSFVIDEQGLPLVRYCNFEFLRRETG